MDAPPIFALLSTEEVWRAPSRARGALQDWMQRHGLVGAHWHGLPNHPPPQSAPARRARARTLAAEMHEHLEAVLSEPDAAILGTLDTVSVTSPHEAWLRSEGQLSDPPGGTRDDEEVMAALWPRLVAVAHERAARQGLEWTTLTTLLLHRHEESEARHGRTLPWAPGQPAPPEHPRTAEWLRAAPPLTALRPLLDRRQHSAALVRLAGSATPLGSRARHQTLRLGGLLYEGQARSELAEGLAANPELNDDGRDFLAREIVRRLTRPLAEAHAGGLARALHALAARGWSLSPDAVAIVQRAIPGPRDGERGRAIRRQLSTIPGLALHEDLRDALGRGRDAQTLRALLRGSGPGAPPTLLRAAVRRTLAEEAGHEELVAILATWPDGSLDSALVARLLVALHPHARTEFLRAAPRLRRLPPRRRGR